MKKILITGGTSMIGSSIVEIAEKSGYKVTCLVRKGSSKINNIPKVKNVSVVECNMDEYLSVDISEKYDIFIHLSWLKPFGNDRDNVELQLKNIQYTLDAVHLAKKSGCSVFIGAGSQAEYGIQKEDLSPKLSVSPESGYGIAKYTAGKMSRMLCEQLGIRFNWLRILSVYGKNDNSYTLVSYVINELKEGRSPLLTKCEQDWDYINSQDAARAFLAVAKNGKDGATYTLGSGTSRKLRSYIEDISRIVAPGIPLNFGAKDYYPHQPMHLVADISNLTKDTGWTPTVSFIDGIRALV